nr:immunoglobulin heavy chain junction region [Mus musculus]MBK4189222.1 immunoglobulin heavy chain junction region [Mus musculus]
CATYGKWYFDVW